LFSFRCTSSVCKRAIQDGPKIKLQTLVNIFTKYWWILPILSVLCPANNFQWRFMTNHTTPKTCGYITLKNNCFQKLSMKHSNIEPMCVYWRECKHNLKLKHKLNFLAHSLRQYRLIMFTNTGSVSKPKSNLT